MSLALALLLVILAGCTQPQAAIAISASPKKYSPFMSSVQGITFTIEEPLGDEDIEYDWTASDGSFLRPNNVNVTEFTGDKVLWVSLRMPDPDDYNGEIITIHVDARNEKSGKIVAEASIRIIEEDVFYIVEE